MAVEPTSEYELRLDEALQKLHQCQQEKQYESCLTCDKALECETRKAYVKAVYESMSKGQGGGFEF